MQACQWFTTRLDVGRSLRFFFYMIVYMFRVLQANSTFIHHTRWTLGIFHSIHCVLCTSSSPCVRVLRFQQSSPDSCRFKLACAECLDSCEVDLNNVIIDRETLPTCKPVPEGVSPPSTAITLQTFDIKEGYYRVSTDSATVLECYQMGACTGGVDPADYCAVGYTGPCKPFHTEE